MKLKALIWFTFSMALALSETLSGGVLDSLQCRFPHELFQKVQDPVVATRLFYRLLDEIQPYSPRHAKILRQLELDVADIFSDKDRQRYEKLLTHTEKVQYLQYFWRREDLTGATEVNERLIEHYNRLIYAREAFSALWPRGYDDRGVIYVKYGQPDERIINTDLAYSDPLETWAYYKFGDPVTFDFINRGEGYRLVLRFDEGIKAADAVSRWIAVGKLLDLRRHLSPQWFAMSTEWESLSNEEVGLQQRLVALDRVINEQTERITTEQKQLPVTSTNLFTDQKALPFSSQIAWFQNGTNQHEFAVLLGVRRQDVESASADTSIQVLAGVGVKSPDHRLLLSRTDTLRFAPHDSLLEKTWQFRLGPGHYIFALDIQVPQTHQREIKSFFSSTGRDNPGLKISSILFARRISPSDQIAPDNVLYRNALRIVPYPFRTISRENPMYIYFEVYNLQKNDEGESYFTIEYSVERQGKTGIGGFLAKLNPFGGARDRISFSETRRSQKRRESVYFLVDFHQLVSGTYRFTVRVEDKNAGLRRERSMEVVLN